MRVRNDLKYSKCAWMNTARLRLLHGLNPFARSKTVLIVWCKGHGHIPPLVPKPFVISKVADRQPSQASAEMAGNEVTRVVIPFKDQDSANLVKTQPCYDLHESETKQQLVNQQCVVYQFQCNLCDTGSYVGYNRRHLFTRVDCRKRKPSSVCKHCNKHHAGAVLEDLLNMQTDSIRTKVFF